ncbi:hypothetical protein CRYUN_Cryun02cG0087000 [Craigia yunnanensis]
MLIVGSISAVSSSLLVGKAGPMVHTGACIASLLGQAAGIAAAFRAPVRGVLFALEEMASWWRSALLWRAFFTTSVVAILLRALIDVCLVASVGYLVKEGAYWEVDVISFWIRFSEFTISLMSLFVSVIVTGASYWRFVGMLLGSHTNLNHGLYAVLGATSFLADAFNGNIYDLIMKAKGFPYLEGHAEPYMRQLTVGDVVSGPLQPYHGIEKVSNPVHIFKTTRHHRFPVIDDPPHSESPILYGLVLRAYLIALLKKRAFLSTPARIGLDAFRHFSLDDFAKKGLVVETLSLAKALILFREVGLRHLLVIPKISNRALVVGILTRHDFVLEHILGLHPLLVRSRWKR